jgi:hypothetical protein
MESIPLRIITLAVLSTIGASCVESEHEWAPEDSVTISSGIYGQTMASCPQVGVPCTAQPAADVAVAAYEGDALPTVTSKPAGVAMSDERGFFQLSLPTGTFRLCRGELRDGTFMSSTCAGAATWVDGVQRSDLF